MIVLGSATGITVLSMSGKKTAATPPINAGSSDEEKFIKYGPPRSYAGMPC